MDVKYETEKCMYKGFNIQDHPKGSTERKNIIVIPVTTKPQS